MPCGSRKSASRLACWSTITKGMPRLENSLQIEPAHAAVAADDRVSGQLRQLALHPLPPEGAADLAAHDGRMTVVAA